MDLCFVSVPFQNLENPSISLSILKATLTRQGLESEIVYANMVFAEKIGLQAYYAIVWSGNYREALLGEYVFSRAAFRGYMMQSGYEEFLRRELTEGLGAAGVSALLAFVAKNAELAEEFIEETAQAVLQRQPRIVACASTTQQNCASLALLRRIKELNPAVITLIGGPNCEDEMGWTLVQSCPWLDFAISGEADSFFGCFCARLLQSPMDHRNLPNGVFYKNMNRTETLPHGISDNLDAIPFPDYDDYFNSLARHSFKESVKIGLLIETSRGCWWGEKHPCSFCGMNGVVRRYRAKTATRALQEFLYLQKKYQINDFFAVDCILSLDHLAQIMPALAKSSERFHIMYEVKSNLTFAQLTALKRAGVAWLQPGIESLEDSLLALMNKGNRAIHHVELLKNMAELKMECCWILLCDFPRENPDWYDILRDVMDKIFHLQPPNAVFKVRYDRFSQYYYHADSYGLQLVPAPAYEYIYPLEWRDKLSNLAYFFMDASNPKPLYSDSFVKEYHQKIAQQAKAWKASYYSFSKERLTATVCAERLEIMDLRNCAKQSLYSLTGVKKAIALICRSVRSYHALQMRLLPNFPLAEIAAAVQWLIDANLILRIEDDLLFLAVFANAVVREQGTPVGMISLDVLE